MVFDREAVYRCRPRPEAQPDRRRKRRCFVVVVPWRRLSAEPREVSVAHGGSAAEPQHVAAPGQPLGPTAEHVMPFVTVLARSDEEMVERLDDADCLRNPVGPVRV